MKITRKFCGQDVQIKLTDEEMEQVRKELEEKDDYRWICDLIDENEYICGSRIARDIAGLYRQKIEDGEDCGLGVAQHEIFDSIIEEFYDVAVDGRLTMKKE